MKVCRSDLQGVRAFGQGDATGECFAGKFVFRSCQRRDYFYVSRGNCGSRGAIEYPYRDRKIGRLKLKSCEYSRREHDSSVEKRGLSKHRGILMGFFCLNNAKRTQKETLC